MGDKLKKFFQLLGITTLICFSFFYTEKVGYVVREMDSLMEEIKEKSKTKNVEEIDALIDGNIIIPDKIGKIVYINYS